MLDRIRLVLGKPRLILRCLTGLMHIRFRSSHIITYPHLRQGALLIVDDTHIPTIHRLFEFLAEDDMYELVQALETTAFCRRTAAPVFSAIGGGWEHQRFNISWFPMK